MRIERVEPHEAAVIAELNQHVHGPHVDAEPDEFRTVTPDEAVPTFVAALADPAHTFFLATLGSQAVGYVWAQELERPENPFTQPARSLFVHHIAVSPDARRAGVGRALMDAVEDEARRRGITRLGLDHWSFNADAARFFEALGFEVYNVRRRRRL